MTDWVLSHTQLTPPHSTRVRFTHLCPSPEHPRSCWKSLLCFLETNQSCLCRQCMRIRSAPQTLPTTSMLHLNVVVYCPEFRTWGMRSSDTRVQYFKTTALLGGRCGNLDWVSPELICPVMSVCTPTDGGETSEVPVVVVSCCVGGKVPYQCCKKDIGY